MSHELESGVFYKEPAWHGLGTVVENVMTAQEAITAAGLDWDVETVNIFHNFKGNRSMIEGRKAIRRQTDGRILGIMGDDYKPVQNREAFGFFDTVVNTKEAKYHTAGSLRGGQRIWILAKLDGGNGCLNIKGDQVDKYLLLLNGHDGSMALKMFFTPIRVVCMNTLKTAESGAIRTETFYSKHTGNISGRMEKAREVLGLSVKFFDDFALKANHLATHQLPAQEMPKLLAAAFGTTGGLKIGDVLDMTDFGTRKGRQMEEVVALFEGKGKGLDNPAIKGTAWAAYNAIVEYVDYGKEYRGDNANDNRLRNAWFDDGMRVKNKAWNYLMTNVK